MPSAGFEPAIPATKPLQTYGLDSAATGIGLTHGMPFLKLLSEKGGSDYLITF
jgi:hypothetical protein